MLLHHEFIEIWKEGSDKIAALNETTLSDGSHVYSIRIYSRGTDSEFRDLHCLNEKHARKVMSAITSCLSN
jgi:hypothetical protein